MARRGDKAKPTTGTLTAAAHRINLNDVKLRQGGGPKPSEWQKDGWAYFDEVPEIKYGVRFLGNAFAKLRLFAAVRPVGADPDQNPIPIGDERSDVPDDIAASAMAEVERLRSHTTGQAALLARLNMNFEVSGECYLVGWGAREMVGNPGNPNAVPPQPPSSDFEPAQPESWQVCSISEVAKKGGKWVVYASPSDKKGRPLDPALDTIIRLWEQHPQWADLPDTAMRGVLNDCKALQVFSQQQYAEGLSKQSAGILLVPNELDTGPVVPTESEEEPTVSPFMERLMRALTSPIEDPSSVDSVVPLVVKGPAEALKEFRHVLLGRQSEDVLDKRMEARINRIARGLNLPVEVVMGHQQTTYANAEQVDQDTFEDHLEPRCALVVDALSLGFLRPNLRESYPAIEQAEIIDRICVWFDASAVVRQPDTEAAADEAFDRFAISFKAYRKAKGYNEDDAPDAAEMLIRAGLRRGILTAELTSALLEVLANQAGVELPDPDALAPGASAEGDAAATAQLLSLLAAAMHASEPPPARPIALEAAARTRPQWNPGRDLTDLDRDLRTRLVVAADAAMVRALEKAGAKMRSKAGKELTAVLRTVDNLHVAATLGAKVVESFVTADELLDGAWDNFEQQFMTWGESAQAEAIDIASRAVSGLADAERATLALRQADDLTSAWSWLRDAMTALANTVMFNPDPSVPEIGEFDPSTRVPPGMLRQAVARAGGAGGLVMPSTGKGAYVTLADAGTRPAGGIGTGELITGVLRDNGAGVEGYRWLYGPAHRQRPFQPHQELDGVEFVNFDDDVLSNTSGFPDFAFYMPGDHDGCICDVEPIIIPADEA